MVVKQLSVFVENKPGRLYEITSILGEHGVEIRAVSISDTTDFGILRLIVSHPDVAQRALKEAGLTVSLTEVLAIGIEDKPGGLSKAMKILYDEKITVEYMYAFISRDQKAASVILRVRDNALAAEKLSQQGISLLGEEEIFDK